MKTKFKSKFLSILLVLVMVLALVPVSALTAFAAEPRVVVTHDVDEIRELLRQDGDVSIKLDADAEKDLDFYFEQEYETEKCDGRKVWAKLGSGNKIIDLNGYRLYVNDKSYDWGASIWQAVLMEIPTGASLTVNDSAGGGKIWMDTPMYFDIWFEGNDGIKIRDIFAVTGGDLTVNGGEIHAGRAKRVWKFYVVKADKNWQWPATDWYEDWYEERGETPDDIGSIYYTGYATQFNSGTAITAYSGNVTINGGEFWGRGWDNISLISRVTNNPNGADDHRDRCAALRVKNGQVTINSGSFYGRSDADAVQVVNPANLTVNAGSFDVGTNDYLVYPPIYRYDVTFLNSDQETVVVGYLGSFGVPTESINDQSVKVTKGNTMTLSKNAIDPYIVIDDLTLHVNAPLDYSDISTEVYRVPEGCTVESVTWYKNGAKIENPESTYFQKGQRYSVYIALSVDIQTGTKFTNRLSDATINGKEAEINRVDEENLIMSVDFGYCTAALEDLEFEVIEPAEGQYANSWADTSEYELYAPVGGYSNYGDFRTWYVSDDGENWTEKSADDVFEAGKYYRFSFEVHAGEGQEFALDGNLDPDVSVTVNGITAATVKRVYDQDPSEHILVQVDFGQCPALISNVELTVTAPKEGEAISYTVGSAQDTYYAIGDNGNYTDYRAWYESDTGYDNWRLMSPGDTFTAGKYYKFVTDVYTKPGYEFPTYDNGVSIMPGVNAYINGYAANVSKGYEQDPSRYITVEYFFGICNDSVVENIIIENVTAPVAGEKPNYNWSIRGNGYQMDTSKNDYYDAYWKNPPEQWYYIKNGLGWFDVTDYDWVYENETFIAGHEYEVRVYVITEDGFEFAHNNYYEPTVTATVNGNTAEAIVDGSYCVTTQQIEYTFTCGAKTVDKVAITDLENPVGGNTPDTAVTVGDSDSYTVERVEWFDIEDNPAAETFESGVPYYALITVAPATGAVFADADAIEVTVNGSELDSVEIKNGKLLVYVIIRKPASAPIVNPYAFTTQPTGGTVSVGETLTAYWQTAFIPTDTEIQYWDGEAWDQWDIQQAQAATDSYDFVSVDAGVYRFRIVAYIGSDVVATSNEFAIAWEEEIVNEYIYVYTPGEGNGSNDFDYATNGTEITLSTPESMGFTPIDGFTFDYWSVRTGSAMGTEMAQKQPGDTIIINDNTYIVAIWKEAPVNKYTVAYGIGEGSGSADFETDIAFGSSFTLKAFGDVGIIAPEGKMFDYWSIRVGAAQSAEVAKKQPGDTIIINDNTFIIAMWKDIPHTCAGVKQTGQSATCTDNGWNDYYKCECGKYYEDANCQISIPDLDAWKVGAGKIAASHNYGTLITATPEKHTQTELVAGIAAHYQCSVCDKYFTFGKVETTLQELTGATPSHSYGAWQTNDNKHWKECSCGLKSEENDHVYDNASDMICNTCEHDRTLPHTHGNGVKQNGQSATCTVDGWKDYYKCSCGKFYTEEACINEITSLDAWKEGAGKIAAEHNYGTLVSAVTEKHTQTELVASVAAYYHCSTCGKYFTEAKAETTLDALTGTTPSHSYGDWKTDADKHWKECSCGKKSDEGNHVDSDSNNKCDTCDKTLPGGGGVTPPPAHTHDYGTAWKTDGENHWYECSCGDKKDSAAHSGGTATCKAKAKCSVCNTEYGELAEHKYSEATCTAKAKCSVCNEEKGDLVPHNYVDGKCSCGATDPNYVPPHEHNFVEGKCECGETDPNYIPPHEHNFVEGKCECGETDPNYIPPHEHNFVEGKCECGETDPNYNPGTDDPEEPDEGLGAGAITGIAVGSVAVVGGGGFALFWFVLKKKTWADLLMVFKK